MSSDKKNTRCLRVLHITSGDLWAGAEAQLFTLARSLQDSTDVDVCVVLLNHGILEQRLHDIGIEVTVVDEAQLNAFKILLAIIRAIRKYRPDVIHTHQIKDNVLGSIAALVSGGIPSLRTTHGAPEHSPPWWRVSKQIINMLDWFCGRYLQQKIVAVSEELKAILIRSYPRSHISTIENGIEIDQIDSSNSNGNTPTDATKGVFKVALAGRLVPVKRVDIFIETAKYLLDCHPDFKTSFHVFGDGPMKEQLENISRRQGTECRVHFEGHCDNLPAKLDGIDAILMTSDHEGLPMILLEAMSLQIPIIAHAVGGIPNLLDNGACGVLVQDNSASAYGREIYRLAHDPQRYAKLQQKALTRVRTHYSARTCANNYLHIYHSVAA